MTRPLLGFSCCRRRVGDDPAQAVMERYLLGAAPHIGATPVLVPSLPDLVDARAVMARLDGLLLTGSPSNLEPARYGEVVPDADGPFDPDRDVMTAALARAALDLGKPVFGICRGFQELNVLFGGTLARDLSAAERPIRHHAPDGVDFEAMFEHAHPVRIEPGGLLEQALGPGEISVNSVHYQGVARLGDTLQVEARAPDGVIEAFSTRVGRAPVLAVQWHPEWRPEADPNRTGVFRLMGQLLEGAG